VRCHSPSPLWGGAGVGVTKRVRLWNRGGSFHNPTVPVSHPTPHPSPSRGGGLERRHSPSPLREGAGAGVNERVRWWNTGAGFSQFMAPVFHPSPLPVEGRGIRAVVAVRSTPHRCHPGACTRDPPVDERRPRCVDDSRNACTVMCCAMGSGPKARDDSGGDVRVGSKSYTG